MFPLRDTIPRVHIPWALWTIIAINVTVFLYQQTMTMRELSLFMHLYGVVPARFSFPDIALQAGYPPGGEVAFITYMFLHGGWSHIIVNMWTLWIFGDNIEDVMGPARFTLFYLTCGLAALLVQFVADSASPLPVVGASGAVAGVLGAYFLLYPHAQVTTLVPLLFIPLIFDLPAVFYMGVWFLTQLFSGLSSLATPGESASVAWWAHLGGFVCGFVLLPLFRLKDRCYFCSPTGPFGRGRIHPPEP